MRYLVMTAYWTGGDPDEATRDLALGVVANVDYERGAGGVVAIAEPNVDAGLRAFLRSVQIEEAANA